MAGPLEVNIAGGPPRCALIGDGPLVAECADIATATGIEVALLVTSNEVVHRYGVERGVPVSARPDDLVGLLREHRVTVVLSLADDHELADDVVRCVELAIHLHDGPVPGYLGLNVTTWAILNEEPTHGITWRHLPTGDIIASEEFPIAADDSAFSLNARCYEVAVRSFRAVAAAIASGHVGVRAVPDGTGRQYRATDRPAVLFDPSTPAATTERAVRALDVGPRIRNSVGCARWVLDSQACVIGSARWVRDEGSPKPVGTIVAVDAAGVRVATVDGDVVLEQLATLEGTPVSASEFLASVGLHPGSVVGSPPADLVAAVADIESSASSDELFWIDRLQRVGADHLPWSWSTGVRSRRSMSTADSVDSTAAVAAFAALIGRLGGTDSIVFGCDDRASRGAAHRVAPLARPRIAIVEMSESVTFADLIDQVALELETIGARSTLMRDVVHRDPVLRGPDTWPAVVVQLDADLDDVQQSSLHPGTAVQLAIGTDEIAFDIVHDASDPTLPDRLIEEYSTLLAAAVDDPGRTVADLDLLGPAELARLDAVNATSLDHDRLATIDLLFRSQVEHTPDAPALSAGSTTMSYRELGDAVAGFSGRLAAHGVGRGDRVGIALDRGLDMVVAVLATLDLGAAYLPLDPTYPTDRLGFMIDDAGIAVLVADAATSTMLERPSTPTIDPSESRGVDHHAGATTDRDHDATDLAYVIYTSGSTGMPKGVMLEHRQVTNFFEAMDQVIDHDPPGVWLAVTSLSFDISVLELLWTLTRGFHVVLKSDRGVPSARAATPVTSAVAARPVTFSLFYFAAGDDAAADGYRLLLDSARIADRNGFEAVWTPERHFHAFGGGYPNPSVTGAALAAVTERIGIRAGSVVLPLHSPLRVAEEWAVVDNISGGRVAISFAAGWQPNDFVLNPGAFSTAKDDLARNIDTVQRLWRGETVSMPGHDGSLVEVGTLPRPRQPELPTWLTSAGSPATFERAGMLGVNVLTHLLGQSIEQLAENIDRYRSAWTAAGHPGEGRVTLMMHTYLDRDADVARETAREPMKGYLGTAVGLLRDFATAFPIFATAGTDANELFASLTPDEMDQLLEMAAKRYLQTSGLFGTPHDAAEIVEAVSRVGVDEVACLVDFGVDTDLVFSSLDLLLETKRAVDARRAGRDGADAGQPSAVAEVTAAVDDSVSALVRRHGVSHLQCTPSLAAMLVADPTDRAALETIEHLMVGGEALPVALADELRSVLPGRFTNMYGPTETTIWSLTHEIAGPPGPSIPIGTPIANTSVFVLDPSGRRMPIGVLGELHIGGEGVARGYHERPELTAERFVDRPGLGRVYATGDVVRTHPDGYVEFIGRADNQVKIRGHRIELGEIESVLDRHPDVVQSVVVARDDRGDIRLLAYVILHGTRTVDGDALRAHVGATLPDAMVPSAVVHLDVFPLTPNGKIDRKALPDVASMPIGDAVAGLGGSADDTERLVAGVWTDALGRAVGLDDNFFDIGGHSLLAVKVFRRLTDITGAALALTDVFRFPTVRTFAAHLGQLQAGGDTDGMESELIRPSGTSRGERRRRALTRRGRDSSDESK